LALKADQETRSDCEEIYPAMEMMFPKEKRTANLAGEPVARLRKEPKERSWMI
jgi:hypothetical protein